MRGSFNGIGGCTVVRCFREAIAPARGVLIESTNQRAVADSNGFALRRCNLKQGVTFELRVSAL